MRNFSNEEIESMMKDLIDRKITREGLAQEKGFEIRTWHKMALTIEKTNPELYKQYVEAFPYQPKVRDDIDYEALVISILKRIKKFRRCIF